ncbi:hypothetical protein OG331_49260 [Streptomyces sp. NBC_01017]|uniref:hypothetical protein n=1 Tax=Streptomyces sp. NBC_01017 TaxID=2903721 RepID=UPI00386365D3|nr:hypothetical protein OG331_02715 [Streptomyces sp. NBC_01017]WSV34997.1 hypothetical protein OG331_49260 [Streptomyces sp. NBC_01017]
MTASTWTLCVGWSPRSNRYLGEDDDVAAPLGAEAGPLQVESSRPIGAVWVLDQLWKLLGIDTALAPGAGWTPIPH